MEISAPPSPLENSREMEGLPVYTYLVKGGKWVAENEEYEVVDCDGYGSRSGSTSTSEVLKEDIAYKTRRERL